MIVISLEMSDEPILFTFVLEKRRLKVISRIILKHISVMPDMRRWMQADHNVSETGGREVPCKQR